MCAPPGSRHRPFYRFPDKGEPGAFEERSVFLLPTLSSTNQCHPLLVAFEPCRTVLPQYKEYHEEWAGHQNIRLRTSRGGYNLMLMPGSLTAGDAKDRKGLSQNLQLGPFQPLLCFALQNQRPIPNCYTEPLALLSVFAPLR